MGAPKGNEYNKKLKTKELRIQAYKQYCEWISAGKNKKAFVFQHPDLSICWQTMEKYILEDNGKELDPIHKEQAEARSLGHWEDVGNEMMMGNVKGCQPAIFQMFMRNKFGWDKDSNITHSVKPEVLQLLKQWEE